VIADRRRRRALSPFRLPLLPAPFPWNHVQGATANSGGTQVVQQSTTFSASVAVGDFVTVLAGSGYAAGPPTSPFISDSGGNSWSVDYNFNTSNNGWGLIGSSLITTGGVLNITVFTNGIAAYMAVQVDEFSLAVGVPSFDSSGYLNSTTTAVASTTALTVSGDDLIVAMGLSGATQPTIISYGGMTGISNTYPSCAYLLNQTTGFTPTWTFSAAVAKFFMISAAYKTTLGSSSLFYPATLALGSGGKFFMSRANN
jgi:hypothetical protein